MLANSGSAPGLADTMFSSLIPNGNTGAQNGTASQSDLSSAGSAEWMDVLAAGLAAEDPQVQGDATQGSTAESGDAASSFGEAVSQFLSSAFGDGAAYGDGTPASLGAGSASSPAATPESQANSSVSAWFTLSPVSLRANLSGLASGIAASPVFRVATATTSPTVPLLNGTPAKASSRADLGTEATPPITSNLTSLLSQGLVLPATPVQPSPLPGTAASSDSTGTDTADPASTTSGSSWGAASPSLQASEAALPSETALPTETALSAAASLVASPTVNSPLDSRVAGLTGLALPGATKKANARPGVSADPATADDSAATSATLRAALQAVAPAVNLLSSLAAATPAASSSVVSLKPEISLLASSGGRSSAAVISTNPPESPSSRGALQASLSPAASSRFLQDSVLRASSDAVTAPSEPDRPAFELTLTEASQPRAGTGLFDANPDRSSAASVPPSSSTTPVAAPAPHQAADPTSDDSGRQYQSGGQPEGTGQHADPPAADAQPSPDPTTGLSKRTTLDTAPSNNAKPIGNSTGPSDGPAVSLTAAATLGGGGSSSAPSKVSSQPESNSPNPPMIPQGNEPAANQLPVRSMNLRVEGNSGETVNVRLTDRAGEVQITVHSSDDRTAASLRQDLSTLSSSLDKAGWKTDVSTPASPSRNSEQSPDQQSRQQNQRQSADDGQQSGRRRPSLIEQWAALANQENG